MELKDTTTGWRIVLPLFFLMASWNALATVESVPPESTQLICFSSVCNNYDSYYAPSEPYPYNKKYTYASAQAWCSAPNVKWSYNNTPPPPGFAATYTCTSYDSAGNYFSSYIFALISAICPAPQTTPAIKYGYNPATGACERDVPDQCPPPDVINPATGQCVHCAIDPLPDLPKDDACTNSLEAGRGKDLKKACPDITKEMQDQAQCLADKIHKLGIPYTEPSATIRTEAYQKHLLKVWDKLIEIDEADLTDAESLACAQVIADANAQKNGMSSTLPLLTRAAMLHM